MSWILWSRSSLRGFRCMGVLRSVTSTPWMHAPCQLFTESQVPEITNVCFRRPPEDGRIRRQVCPNVQSGNRSSLLLAEKPRKSFPIDAQDFGSAGLVPALLLEDPLRVPPAERLQRR